MVVFCRPSCTAFRARQGMADGQTEHMHTMPTFSEESEYSGANGLKAKRADLIHFELSQNGYG
jgi:hypothetical protein